MRGLKGLVVLGAFAAATMVWTWPGTAQAAEAKQDSADVAKVAAALAELFPQTVEKVMPSVVSISTTKKVKRPEMDQLFDFDPFGPLMPPSERQRRNPATPRPRMREYTENGLGSGFVIDKSGWIITNNHVVRDVDASDIKVRFSADGAEAEKVFSVKEVKRDPKTDVAVIKIDGGPFPALQWGDSGKVRVGEWALAIGSPLGFGNSVTSGIISATTTKKRVFSAGGPGTLRAQPNDYAVEDYIQTDAAINMGNSGGPLTNLKGEVIGMSTLIVSPTGTFAGLGFAIPSNTVRGIAEQLITKGKIVRGWLGVQMVEPKDLTDEAAWELFKSRSVKSVLDEYRVKVTDKGVLVVEVLENSPAEKAKFERGDLIVKFDGKKIEDSETLRNLVMACKVGDTIAVDIIRKGKDESLKVTIGEQPSGEKETTTAMGSTEADKLGVTVQEITPAVAKALQLDATQGVVVTDVAEDGPAVKKGIQVNDVILRVGKKNIKTLDDFKAALAEHPDEKTIAVFVKTDGDAARWVEVTVK
jgi:serine protease Do